MSTSYINMSMSKMYKITTVVFLPSHITTSNYSKELGYAEITHPYHPLIGQKFKILKVCKKGEREIFTLSNFPANGAFRIPRDWTDKAYPEKRIEYPVILSCPHLLEMVSLLQPLSKKLY